MSNHLQLVLAILLLFVTTNKLQTIEAFSIHLLRKPFQSHLTETSSSTVSLVQPFSKFYGNVISSALRCTKNTSYLPSFSGNVDRLSNPAKRRFLNKFNDENSEILFDFDFKDVEEAINVPSFCNQNSDPAEITNHDLSESSSSFSVSDINQGDSSIGHLNTDCDKTISENSVSDIPQIVLEELENAVITALKK